MEDRMLSQINDLLPGVRKLNEESFELLGAPIFQNGINRILNEKYDVVKIMCDRLKILDVHPALCLFKSSLSTPKFLFILRSSPTFLQPNALKEIDAMFRSTLQIISNTKMDDISWRQASLPYSLAGLGIRKVEELAVPAYFSSLYKSLELSNYILRNFNISLLDQHTIMGFIQQIPGICIPASDEEKKIQKNWDHPNMKSIFNDLINMSEPGDKARLLASCQKESSKWLHVIPSIHLGLLLDNNSARIAVALRLGSEICENHVCVCGVEVDKRGRHGLSCKRSSGRLSRHSAINHIISKALSTAGFPNIMEPPGVSRSDGKRPDGMSLIPWREGKSLLWDVTVGDTLAPSYLSISSQIPGSVADQAERRKLNHYKDLMNNHHFYPVSFETFGTMGPDTRTFLNLLGKYVFASSGEKKSMEYLLQRISIAIQRGNAACIFGTFGDFKLDDLFLL
jgi:hypothetical protein